MKTSTKFYLCSGVCIGLMAGVLKLDHVRSALFILLMTLMLGFNTVGDRFWQEDE